MNAENALNIYTDGSSGPNKDGGVGWIFVLVDGKGSETRVPVPPKFGYDGADSPRMELQACVLALRIAREKTWPEFVTKIVIHTDATYVSENFRHAKFTWPKNKWRKVDGGPLIDEDLWRDLKREAEKLHKSGMPVEIRHVEGHSGNMWNTMADQMAKESARLPINKPRHPTIVRRKLSPQRTRDGSVDMHGQRLVIRISESKRLKRDWRYRYEVLSEGPYHGLVDRACSKKDLLLRTRRTYEVRMGNVQRAPTIEEKLSEVTQPGALGETTHAP